jgi:tetratricopeptide (TPR) repeat protein
MTFEQYNLKGIAAATAFVVALLGASAAFAADSMDEGALLEALAQADSGEAIRLDRELQALWGKSGSAAMDLLLKRGRDAREAGDLRQAIEHLTALTDHAPDFAEGWHARASVYFEAGLYGPALADLERALHLNPNNYNAIFGLAALLEQFNDPERAFEAYRRAQAIHPHHEEVTKALERLKPEVEGKTL